MQFPPPPSLVFLAYIQGNISKKEYLELLELWNEKHEGKTMG